MKHSELKSALNEGPLDWAGSKLKGVANRSMLGKLTGGNGREQVRNEMESILKNFKDWTGRIGKKLDQVQGADLGDFLRSEEFDDQSIQGTAKKFNIKGNTILSPNDFRKIFGTAISMRNRNSVATGGLRSNKPAESQPAKSTSVQTGSPQGTPGPNTQPQTGPGDMNGIVKYAREVMSDKKVPLDRRFDAIVKPLIQLGLDPEELRAAIHRISNIK